MQLTKHNEKQQSTRKKKLIKVQNEKENQIAKDFKPAPLSLWARTVNYDQFYVSPL